MDSKVLESLLILEINSKIINNTITTESVKSELDSNFVSKDKINLSSLKQIKITEEIINKYKKDYPVLRHVRCKDTKEYKCDGYMWLNNNE